MKKVSYSLNNEQKKICTTENTGAALSFLNGYSKDGDEFLTHIVTGDIIPWFLMIHQNKHQSMQLRGINLVHPPDLKSSSRYSQFGRLLATVFWAQKGTLLVEFITHGTIENADTIVKQNNCDGPFKITEGPAVW